MRAWLGRSSVGHSLLRNLLGRRNTSANVKLPLTASGRQLRGASVSHQRTVWIASSRSFVPSFVCVRCENPRGTTATQWRAVNVSLCCCFCCSWKWRQAFGFVWTGSTVSSLFSESSLKFRSFAIYAGPRHQWGSFQSFAPAVAEQKVPEYKKSSGKDSPLSFSTGE